MQPGFHHDRLQSAVGAMLEVIEWATRWRQARREGRSIDVESEMTTLTLTLGLMATAMLGVRLSRHDLKVMGRAFGVVLKTYRAEVGDVHAAAHGGAARAGARPARSGHVGQDRRSAHRAAHAHPPECPGPPHGGVAAGDMSRQQLRDEVVTLLFGGYEATALGLAWVWYLMDRHTDVGERVREEALAGDPGEISGLAFTRQVIDEALRLYPPFWEVLRSSHEPDEIGPQPAGRRLNTSTAHRPVKATV